MFGLGYNIKHAFIQIFRNRGMSLASIFSILAMLLILGICFVIIVNVNLFMEVVKQDYDQIEVYISDNAKVSEIEEAKGKLEHYDGVSSVAFRSKDTAIEIMKERWGESGYLLDSLKENPLPASFLISVDTLEDAKKVAAYAETFDCVDDVKYYQETVEKLAKITNFLQIACMIVMAFLVVVSIVVVSNTIKLTVMARADEIYIMKYVGATNWFIRGPFMTEGIIIGLIASGISSAAIIYIYQRMIEAMGEQIYAIVSCPLISVEYMGLNLTIIFVALGCAIGAWGSIVSMRRYLKA